jgi:hypothetical protein
MPGLTRKLFAGTALYPKVKALGHYPDYFWWVLRGKPARTPHLLKQRAVLEYGKRYRLRTIVETGTYYGEMIDAVLGHFDRIYSIELNPELVALARRRFEHYTEVRILEGSSQHKVLEVLDELDEPALFWLDCGYYCWDGQRGSEDRLAVELQAILSHRVENHIVLIDDARGFTGANGTLTAAQLAAQVEQDFPARKVVIERDIIRITLR